MTRRQHIGYVAAHALMVALTLVTFLYLIPALIGD